MLNFSLIPHPESAPLKGRSVEAYGAIEADSAVLSFVVSGPLPVMPANKPGHRADGLWRTTCFEMFIRPRPGDAYFEFNFSPSTDWAAYAFQGYRNGMSDWQIASAPLIEPIENGVRISVALAGLPPAPWNVGLSAVIEERDGTKSYWALAHAPGPPDFHNRDCFIATLPAPERP